MINEELRTHLINKMCEGEYDGIHMYQIETDAPELYQRIKNNMLAIPSVDEFMDMKGVISTIHGLHCDGHTTIQLSEENNIEIVCIPTITNPNSHDCVVVIELILNDTITENSFNLCGQELSWDQFNPRHIEEGVSICYEQLLRNFCIQLDDEGYSDLYPAYIQPPRFFCTY